MVEVKTITINDKYNKHWSYYTGVNVECICGNKFTINTTIQWPIKVESCPACHQAYNKGKIVKKIAKWRMEKFLEKQKRMEQTKNNT